ncbi:MAG: TetR/AcrR family transcriptional regulator [Thermus sp.]|uniref:TetR/AcrR family transcriptional regulator n=1 Tax=Thermus sp. TaxID=275 RepID=UPI0033173615
MSRKQEILTAASKLFSQKGFHATSIRHLAKALGVQGGSLYAHISSKEEILVEIVRRAAERFLSIGEDLSGSPVEKLRRLIQKHLEVIAEEQASATVFFHEWKFLPEEKRRQVLLWRDTYERLVQRVVEEGVEAGVFRVENPRLATLFLLSALNWTYQWYRKDGPLSLKELAEEYARLALNALGAREVEDGEA